AQCKDPCEDNVHCIPGYYCNDRSLNGAATGDCETKLAASKFCDEATDCASGHCVEIGDVGQGPDVGVCCGTGCNGFCNTCVTGACVAYGDFTDPDLDCGGCEVCDGLGGCRPVDPDADLLDDPKAFCAQGGLPIPENVWSCGLSGACDGLGACDVWHDGEVCHSAECGNCRIEDQHDYCGPTGECVYQGPGDPCANGLGCNDLGLDCRTTCADDLGHCCQLLWETPMGPPVPHPRQCRAGGTCSSCNDSPACPAAPALCCGGDSCANVKTLSVGLGAWQYRTSTEGADPDFSHGGLGVLSPDRVYSFTTGATPMHAWIEVSGQKAGGAAVDTWIYLRRGDCATGTVVASNDDCSGGVTPPPGSCISYNLEASTTYYLIIDGKGSATDRGDLSLVTTFSYFCGSGTCDPGEVCGVCKLDCSPCCGDGTCDQIDGETSCNCSTEDTFPLDDPATVFGPGDCDPALAGGNACPDTCCSPWDCATLCHADCDSMPLDCGFVNPPVGALESVTSLGGGQYQVKGWACDPDHPTLDVAVKIHDDWSGTLLLKGTFTASLAHPTWSLLPGNVCGQGVAFQGTITIPSTEELAHGITARAVHVDIPGEEILLPDEICTGVCGDNVCDSNGCGQSCGTCTPACVHDGDGTYSMTTGACATGQCVTNVPCAEGYACDGDASKVDGDACATACAGDDDDFCALNYTCEGVACVPVAG
ncbi:MAG: hypothetical protein FJ098_13755, partial [Deltaproteobacteria bacterium]|nr:hypothetical protein [Deltaproteobacteria bacterium]